MGTWPHPVSLPHSPKSPRTGVLAFAGSMRPRMVLHPHSQPSESSDRTVMNGLPDRLDLAAGHVRDALAAGVKIVCSTDAHSTRGLGNMLLSVTTARRGGAGRASVVNTLPLAVLPTR